MHRAPDDQTFFDDIEVYFSQLSYGPADTAALHVSTTAAQYNVAIERWGAQRVEVFRADGLVGHYTPAPDDADANGCCWPVSPCPSPAWWKC